MNEPKRDIHPLAELAAAMYTGEPCRVCGVPLTMDDMRAGAVFAGYSVCNRSRCAHRKCWEDRPPQDQWVFPEDAPKTERKS